jgi:hypothetical protein
MPLAAPVFRLRWEKYVRSDCRAWCLAIHGATGLWVGASESAVVVSKSCREFLENVPLSVVVSGENDR